MEKRSCCLSNPSEAVKQLVVCDSVREHGRLVEALGCGSLNVMDILPEIIHFIQKRSEMGELVTSEEILEDLVQRGILKPEAEEDRSGFETLLKEAIENHEEMREISDKAKRSYYYSTRGMTEAYAGILIQKGEDPLALMAETIRENSLRYPRPVRLDMFEEPPFGLTPNEISSCLKRMTEEKAYQDIQQTSTSIGTVFLYSKLHLEPDYASMLAEWFDVGQSKSP